MIRQKLSVFATAVSLVALTTLSGCAGTSPNGASSSQSSPLSAAFTKNMESASTAVNNGNLQEAAAFYGRAASLQPDNSAPLIALADVLWQMQNAAEAGKVLERARMIDPNNKTILRNLGRAYVGQNNAKKAEEAYLAALAVDPADVRTLSGLGIAYDMDGDHETAQRHYRAGLAIDPYNLELQNNLSYSLILAGDYKGAIDILEPLVNRPNASPRQRQNLAMAYGMLGQEADVRRVAGADLSPVEIERNLKVYQSLRDGGDVRGVLKSAGSPNFAKGGLSTKAVAEPVQAPASTPEPVAVDEAPEAVTTMEIATPAEEKPAPKASKPVVLSGEKAPPPSFAEASEGAPPVAAPVAAAEPVAPAPAPSAALTAPAATSNGTNFGISGAKVYLGQFPSEAAARQAWIKVWTANSALLSSLVAGIEPTGGEFALYGVGADSKEAASSICDKLRVKGVSCGVGG